MNAQALGAAPHAGDGTGVSGGLRETGGCSGMEGAVGGVTSTAHNTLYSALLCRHCVGQPIIFRDLSSGAVTANLGSHSGVPNLFRQPAPVYVETLPAGAPSTAPTAAVYARSAPAARVDKSRSDTALSDQCLANYEARLRQEVSVSLGPNAMAGTRGWPQPSSSTRGRRHL